MAKHAHTTAAYTTEFHREFKVETVRLLRRRFLWFAGVVGTFALIGLVVAIARAIGAERGPTLPGEAGFAAAAPPVVEDLRWWMLAISTVGLYGVSFGYAIQRRPTDETLVRLSLWVVTAYGAISVFARALGLEGATVGLSGFFFTHLVACLFLPWTALQAIQPMALVLGANAVLAILARSHPVWSDGVGAGIAALAMSPLLAVPGALLCLVRHSRRTQDFKYRFMTSRYSEMRRELVDARRIHESLFPQPFDTGGLRLTFEYEPMRQLGGDFLYANWHQSAGALSPVSIVLLDVTGHGIPAALTVNRLHGEMERVFAENPEVGPGEVLGLLNRYVHLTLATHSIYVTAMCVRVDPARSTIEYASGGHPPAFIRAVDGTIEELASTAFVLGACPDEAFAPGQRELRFGPGDTLIAYTDGAIEAKAEDGRMLRVEGLRRLVAGVNTARPDDWPVRLRQQVASYREGPPADDTLFLTLHRPVTAVDRSPDGKARSGRPAETAGSAGVSA